MAGIKFKRIGVPQAEDVIKASSRDILKNLNDVNEDVLHLFADTAKCLIDQNDGNAEKALQIALAYCSGHYKHKLVSKSLLNGQENFTTLKLWSQRGVLGIRDAYSILKKYWDPRVGENTRNMKNLRDGSGVVFDIRSDNVDAFLDNFDRLKETNDYIDFEIAKCKDLPDLEEEGGYAQNWRDQPRDNYKGNQRGYDRQGKSGYDRGGYDRGGYENRGFGGRDSGWGAKRGGEDYDEGQSWRGQHHDSYQPKSFHKNEYGGGPMGFSSNASDFRPKTGAPAGSTPIIGNKQSKSKGTHGKMVFVSNLRYQVNEQELMDYFKQAGFEPIRSRLLYDNEGNSKGSGFVEMSSEQEATEAVAKLHNEPF
jgi:hypothetical protein